MRAGPVQSGGAKQRVLYTGTDRIAGDRHSETMPRAALLPPIPSQTATAPVTALGVLRRLGLTARQCADIVTRAKALRTGPEAVAIAWGLVTEDAFYAGLARALGIGFLRHPFPIDRRCVSPYAAEAGLTRDERGRLIAAPQGEALDCFLASRPAFSLLTTPTNLRASQRIALCHVQALTAAGELGLLAPHETAHRDGSASGFVGVAWLLALIAIIFCEPVLSLPVTVPLFMLFIWTIAQRIVAVAAKHVARRARPVPPLTPGDLPFYSVLVPLYREDEVIGALVEALAGLEYPPEKLEILFLVEAQDEMTHKAFDRFNLPPFMRILRCPDGTPRTKPRALNIGLNECRGECVVIYDAEDRPDPDQLAKAAALFRTLPHDVACLQAELAIEKADENFFTRGFALEYAILFQLIVPSLCAFNLPVALGGTSNHFRRTALLALRGWDAWNVTEDADLGLRLAWHGYRIAHLPSQTWEEAPANYKIWRQQRVRWIKGWMQTALVHLRGSVSRWRALNMFQKLAMLHHLIGTPIAALLTPLFALALVAGWNGEFTSPVHEGMIAFGSALALAGMAAMAALLISAEPVMSRRARWCAIVYSPLYGLLMSACAWLALWELVRHPFRWNKTPHGASAAFASDMATPRRIKRARKPSAVQSRGKALPASPYAQAAPRR